MVRAIDGKLHTIVHHDEDRRFKKDTPDIEWMATLAADGEPNWVVISGDGRILKNRVERAVLREARLPFFCLAKQWPNTPIYEYAWKFMKVRPVIVENAEQGRALVFTVASGGSLKVEAAG
jgi:hypothetical protein